MKALILSCALFALLPTQSFATAPTPSASISGASSITTIYRCALSDFDTGQVTWGTILDRPRSDESPETLALTPIVSSSLRLVEGVVYVYLKNDVPVFLLQIRLNHAVVATEIISNPRPWPSDTPSVYSDLTGDGSSDIELSCFSWKAL